MASDALLVTGVLLVVGGTAVASVAAGIFTASVLVAAQYARIYPMRSAA
jgi:hypothetical protein